MSITRRSALKILSGSMALAVARAATCQTDAGESGSVEPGTSDWPWWRGPAWDGSATGDAPPLSWSETENIVWKTPIAGRGHSTPSLWGERIFLTTAEEEKELQSVLCVRRGDGRTLWTKQLHAGGFGKKHNKNSHASATPACDGQRVFVVFHRHDALWVTALDFDGEVLWQKNVGAYNDRYGYGSSPTIFGGALVVAADSPADGYIVALDRATGRELWRTPRPAMTSYGAPLVADVGGRMQIVVQGHRVAGYEPQSGREFWNCAAPAKATACSLCFDDERVYASGGYPERRLYAIAADGKGDVTDSHIAWKYERRSAVTYVPSPVLLGERLFVISDGGLATCLSTADGDEVWSERLGGDCSASPIRVGETIIAANEEGRTYVFQAADKFELVAENRLSEGAFASPVICGGRLFLRTTGHLYCIGT